MDQEELKQAFANPFYAIVVNKTLAEDHEPLISEEDWVKVNAKLIGEIGAEEWLNRLLDNLKGKRS